MFVDHARIFIQAGNGGKGCESFYQVSGMRYRHRDGGNGGKGGDIIIRADTNLHTLLDFQYRQHFRAPSGKNGSSNTKTGAVGEDRVILVPPGTIIRDAEHMTLMRDLDRPGESVQVARGGAGGLGNHGRQGATEGAPGEKKTLFLELKLIADIGIIGYPNAGKSSFLNLISQAHSKVASFPFTTLAPVLGVIGGPDEARCVVADIPGIIADAHKGKGLGLAFLKHIERTKVLMFLVDMAGVDGRDPVADYRSLREELEHYDRRMLRKEYFIVANKMDLRSSRKHLKHFQEMVGEDIVGLSCVTASGKEAVVAALFAALERDTGRRLKHEVAHG